MTTNTNIDTNNSITGVAIYNGTPHEINIIAGAVFDPNIRKYVGGAQVLSIPSTGMLNASIDTAEAAPVAGIPCYHKQVKGSHPLTEGFDVYIVSAMYASALGNTSGRIYTVADPVMSDDGKTFHGCRGIQPWQG